MPYEFSFDLSRLSRSFFKEVAKISTQAGLHRRVGEKARHLVEKFKIHELTGLEVADALTVVEDLIDVNFTNLVNQARFLKSKERALFLPHCARKYMDKRCQAHFDADRSSYFCQACSPDCQVNQATRLAKDSGYDVYVVAGGSCIPEILRRSSYEGVVGVACCQELKLALRYVEARGVSAQVLPLTKNGCSGTRFHFEGLRNLIQRRGA